MENEAVFLSIKYEELFIFYLQMATTVGPDGRPHYVYTISGVRVEFPAKAYPSQIAMMDKVTVEIDQTFIASWITLCLQSSW